MGLNFEKIKKNPSEPLEIYTDSSVSQKARQNQITYFKSTGKISLGGRNFQNPVMSSLGNKIRFQNKGKFAKEKHIHCSNCQSLSNGYVFHRYIASL